MSTATASTTTTSTTTPTPLSPATSLLAPNSFKGYTLDQIFKALEAGSVTPAQIHSIEGIALWNGMQQGNSSAADPVQKLFILLGSRIADFDFSFFWQIRLTWIFSLTQYLTPLQIAQFKFDQCWQIHGIFGGWGAIDMFLGNLGAKAQFLSCDLVHNFEREQIKIIAQYLTAPQVGALLTDRFVAIAASLRPEQLTQVSAAQLAELSVDQIKNFSPAQLAALPANVLATLPISTLQQLSPAQIKAMTPEQFAALTALAWGARSVEQSRAIAPAVFGQSFHLPMISLVLQ